MPGRSRTSSALQPALWSASWKGTINKGHGFCGPGQPYRPPVTQQRFLWPSHTQDARVGPPTVRGNLISAQGGPQACWITDPNGAGPRVFRYSRKVNPMNGGPIYLTRTGKRSLTEQRGTCGEVLEGWREVPERGGLASRPVGKLEITCRTEVALRSAASLSQHFVFCAKNDVYCLGPEFGV